MPNRLISKVETNYDQNNLVTTTCSKVLQIKGTPWDISLY